jgi:FMN reductase
MLGPPETSRREAVVLIGHPSSESRTSAVAQTVADRLAVGGLGEPEVVELADHRVSVHALDDDVIRSVRDVVCNTAVLVVATPVYKGGPTGLLKTFLDGLEATALESTVAVPVVLSASSAHGALADLQLRVVLQTVGALVPVPSFVVEEHHLDDLPQYVDAWQQRFGPAIDAVARALGPRAAVR